MLSQSASGFYNIQIHTFDNNKDRCYSKSIMAAEQEGRMNIARHDTTDDTNGKRTYTVKEISEILGVSSNAAYALVKSGYFKTVRIGATIRISKKSFDSWLDNNQ